jgi:hypothetical protein
MGGRLRAGLAAALLFWPAGSGAAEVEWSLSQREGRPYLRGMPKESEVDNELWAHCRADGAIDIGAGAESHVGRGAGEAVTLKLASGRKKATLTGVSRESANTQMTGGIELRATVGRDHPLFAVLATGKPIFVSGPINKLTWPVKGLKAEVAAFLRACK